MHDLLDGEQVDVAEGLPLLAQSSFVSAHAAIAFFDAKRLLDELCVVAAMDIEGYAANPSPYNPLCATVRPYEGYRAALEHINLCLKALVYILLHPAIYNRLYHFGRVLMS